MTEKNFKNQLQEYCVSKKLDLPKYTTIQNNTNQWMSNVTCAGQLFTSEQSFKDKKSAEKNIAEIAYNAVNSSDAISAKAINITQSSDIYHIFCDVENLQPDIPNEIYTIPNITIHTFRSVYSSTKMDDYKQANQHEINSNASNAADHLMTFKAGQLIGQVSPETTFVIVSKDRSSGILATLLHDAGFKVEQYFNTKTFKTFIERITR